MAKKPETTLMEVAEHAGVHYATASRALDPSKSHLLSQTTVERVRKVAEQLGYRANLAARELRKGVSHTIGVAVADFGNPFLAPILRGMESVLGEAGYWPLIGETGDDPDKFKTVIRNLMSRNIDGIIVSSARFSDEDLLREVSKTIPLVLAVRDLNRPGFYSVTHDDFMGGNIAAKHLIELGHRKISQIKGLQDASSFHGRAAGFESALAEAGLKDYSVTGYQGKPNYDGGFEGAMQLLSQETFPTAIFAHNDAMAVGAMEAFSKVGIHCPRDYSIIGYNDAPMTARLDPPLSTIRLTAEILGQKAAEQILLQIEQTASTAIVERLEPELVARESTRQINFAERPSNMERKQ
jgi:LacI family transcriptional regulator